jgi:hypothetical protein
VTKNQQGRGQAGNLLMVNRFSDKKYLRVKPGRKNSCCALAQQAGGSVKDHAAVDQQ